jgi:hypothetical protein
MNQIFISVVIHYLIFDLNIIFIMYYIKFFIAYIKFFLSLFYDNIYYYYLSYLS